ncbi:phosphate/phosphite/phosphonate ABC transporter substrate-binding protein [Acidithiobacillus sp. CV18-2]|uniref:Phosphate/phosphite/phosphonate ABC transporter substrate-binding protein n=1 Tax=Igneacidithiobacillus copahuensis TaxID=2724909 RepID=A0AAE2YNR7_9PROT|nr:phosphate/phosphite/phosphonate ABC transporter substrate-binding protein [Igneacidithiobacillus copahuensis]MBU2754902.1 phosphate/phosphite/phosphonate ABC transporter substrate-binding protein [Acidithiobacillus sp. CV18-3]MBU2758432.1 phosphate/phosphite/phosphonate ABC transporter substrate-binding protein [Acidithiobacillus sp. BN09-2]MBU2778388.1 phosphate/phosphite/phosphonate ABC transporter substrate-binding protein [Acidithiobacillus sp. CV18-2]MBU2797475.1 phosphate/phosphite/pho
MYGFTVDPNYSGKNLPGWFLMSTYLQRQLHCSLHFSPQDDFAQGRNAVLQGGIDLVYANPFDWVQYVEKKGFIPVAKPKEHFDEVLLCSRKGSPWIDFASLPERIHIASATDATLVHMVGLFLLDKAEIDRARLDFTFTGSYQSALKSLLQGRVDLAFVFDEVYSSASRITQESLQVIAQSDDAFAFHAFCISPRLAHLQDALCTTLCSMEQSEAGQRLLQDIGFSGFAPVNADEVACLTALAEEYISGHEAIDLRATSTLAIDDSAFLVAREEPGEETK